MKNVDYFDKKGLDVKFDLINTRYLYVETIGTGAYGVVCHAKSNHDTNDYAIKKIKKPFTNKVTLIRALREIKILSHFNHPNIINIVDIFLQNNGVIQDVYVVFNLMESDLHKIISSNQNLSDDHIRYFMYQILCGVNYIHSASVIHRDLKPANILINSNCLVKITDFGMARLCATSFRQSSNLSKSQVNMNMTQYVMTRWYRAPELLMGQISYNSKIDLWSCGCIISELYLKEAIFRGDNMILQLKDIIKKIGVPNDLFRSKVLPIVNSLIDNEGKILPPPMSQLIPSAPKKVIDLLSHLLVYDSDERWSAKQALRHIFFIKYRNPGKETICESTLDLSFEEEQKSIECLKKTLFEEISSISSKYNPVFSLQTPSVTSVEIKDVQSRSSFCIKEELSTDSNLSDRTLSADFDNALEFPLKYYNSKNEIPVKYSNSPKRSITVSQSTRNKLINSLSKPKDKLHKKTTAVQRQKERNERRSRLKVQRKTKFKNKLIVCGKTSEQLSEWDKSSLQRWEYLSHSKLTQTNNQIMDISRLNINRKTDEVDEMSAGLLSSLSILDDINGVLISNIKEDRELDKADINLDDFLDIDCIDLDINILESYSADLFKDCIGGDIS